MAFGLLEDQMTFHWVHVMFCVLIHDGLLLKCCTYLPCHDLKSVFFSVYPYLPLAASLVCLLQSSRLSMAQLFSRWSVLIREFLEAITLLKCSTAVNSLSTMLKCPFRTLSVFRVVQILLSLWFLHILEKPLLF